VCDYTGSGACQGRYSFMSRFGVVEPPQTTLKELLGAAHAGCFSLSLANTPATAGYDDIRVRTDATVKLASSDGRHRTAQIDLETAAYIPEIDDEVFLQYVETANEQCPMSQALTGVDISIAVERVGSWAEY